MSFMGCEETWEEVGNNDICREKHPPGIRAYSTGTKEPTAVSTYLSQVDPKGSKQTRDWAAPGSPPFGDRCQHQAYTAVSGRDCRPLPGDVSNPPTHESSSEAVL